MSNKTILFADDSATMRTIMEKTFVAEPFDVVAVPSGEAAIAQAKKLRPNVIVVDAGMAGVSGYDVCKSVREDSAIGRTPLIIMSGVSNLYDENRGQSVGVTQHVKKPFDTGQLIQLITELAETTLEAAPEVSPEVSPTLEPAPPQAEVVEAEVVEELETLSEPPLEQISIIPEEEELTAPDGETATEEVVEEIAPEPEPIQLTPKPKPTITEAKVEEKAAPRVEARFSVPKIEEKLTTQAKPSETSDFGEVPLGVEEPASEPAPEVTPIELGTSKSEAASPSFQVGTLAELAQMDGQARPIEPSSDAEAIEIEEEKVTKQPASVLSAVSEAKTPFSGVEAKVRDRVDDAAKDLANRVEGITVEQAEAIQTLTREVIERVVWEVVPDLAEVIIKEELNRLLEE